LRFKLDENADPRWREPLTAAGHDVSTASEQSLAGVGDHELAEACRAEKRCLVTLDVDFAQILDFPPQEYAGLIVLRHPRPSLAAMRDLVRQLVMALEKESPVGRLWILEPGRLRIHQDRSD
jgi:predicted nuclease of predicted toxin-antitoxin system